MLSQTAINLGWRRGYFLLRCLEPTFETSSVFIWRLARISPVPVVCSWLALGFHLLRAYVLGFLLSVRVLEGTAYVLDSFAPLHGGQHRALHLVGNKYLSARRNGTAAPRFLPLRGAPCSYPHCLWLTCVFRPVFCLKEGRSHPLPPAEAVL